MAIPEWKLKLEISVWLSSVQQDLDNVLKPFLDILQKKYSFDDDRIYEIHAKKHIVKKWEEYIDFSLSPCE